LKKSKSGGLGGTPGGSFSIGAAHLVGVIIVLIMAFFPQ
jgi:hypothetical protein